MQEIELKFQIPADSLDVLSAELQGMPGHTREHLQAHYVDTPDRRLGQARSALRLRKEGRRWVQTLKAVGANTMIRLEDNQAVPAPAEGSAARVDLSRHLGTPGEAPLAKALVWDTMADPKGERTGLIELYRTDIWRQTARVTVGDGMVELALDLGHIHAGNLSMAVCELEIESVEGPPMAVIDAARTWVTRHGLWLDTRTKAHRGDALARQAAGEAARVASASAWTKASAGTDLASALEDLTDQMSAVSSGSADLPHSVAAWRQALRGLLAHDQPAASMPEVARLLNALDDDGAQAVALARSPSTTLLCLDLFAELLRA
ncbi:MAG: CYTH domain-containing protein [Rubrivivax sp.]|nr:MAG: CYTH domain-containing protein [Rubrivivax sp.]